MTRRDLAAVLVWGAALAVLGVTGLVQGRMTGRWSSSSLDLDSAASRLDRLPLQIGTWIGSDLAVDAVELRRAGIHRAVQRTYRDSRTGAAVTVFLVCGRPGPISVHTPEVCYAGAGYEMAQSPSSPFPGFLAAQMVRTDAAISEALQVYWSWNASGGWETPNSPRLRFATSSFLYKMYVIHSVPTSETDLQSGPAPEFLRELVATLDLSPRPASPGSP